MLVVALAAGLVFASSLTHQLVWDDVELVRHVQSLVRRGGLLGLATADFIPSADRSGVSGFYRPLVLFSVWSDGSFAAWFPWAYHTTNVLLHCANAVLVYRLLCACLGVRRAALIGALLFAVHPVHTEAVAFVSGRTDLWATLFVLLSVLAWDRDRGRGALGLTGGKILSTLFFFLAGLSKEVALVLPALLLIRDAAGAAARPPWWKRNAPWVALWVLALSGLLALRWWGVGLAIGQAAEGGAAGRAGSLALAPAIGMTYMRLLVFPWPLRAFYHPDILRFSWVSLAGAAVLTGLCLSAVRGEGRRPGLLAFSWIAIFLLPASGLIPIKAAAVAERFLYLPSVGLALIVGYHADRLLFRPGWRSAGAVFLVAAGLGCGVWTVVRANVWKDNLTLFSDLIAQDPQLSFAHNNLGLEYDKLGRYAEAVENYDRALRVFPDNDQAAANRGWALFKLGRHAEALDSYRSALRVNPGMVAARLGLARVFSDLGRFAEAAGEYRLVVGAQPELAVAHLELGYVYGRLRSMDLAVLAYETAVRLEPGQPLARFNLAVTYLSVGRRADALAQHDALARLDPESASRLRPLLGAPRTQTP